jgi:hypothetical protein
VDEMLAQRLAKSESEEEKNVISFSSHTHIACVNI